MKVRLLVLLHGLVLTSFAQDTSQQKVSGRHNSVEQQQKPYVLLISADGFRSDFAEKFGAVNLVRQLSNGIRALYMQPSFPSLTFPNHYTLVTGLYPAHHGLVDNSFYDRKRGEFYNMSNRRQVDDGYWYGGKPLWVLAEQQQLLSAGYFWVGSEAAIDGIRPTYYYKYHDKASIEQRLNVVRQWLQLPDSLRPHLVCFYFPQVDHAAHLYGPDAAETGEAVRWVDAAVGAMMAMTDSLGLPVNYVFVADHGMTKVDNDQPLRMPPALDSTRFGVSRGDALLQLYARQDASIKKQYRALEKTQVGFTTYLKKRLPKRWHYGPEDDRYGRVGDILLIPAAPKIFGFWGKSTTPGKHGYDPAMPDMRATFAAWGPGIKKAGIIPAFENIHVYPFIAALLGLSYDAAAIDGKAEVLAPYLNTQR